MYFNRPIFSYFKNIRNVKNVSYITKVTTDIGNFVERTEAKYKGTMVEKWIQYWKNLYMDYQTVTRDLITESKQKPFKTVTILSAMTFAAYCAKKNPDERNYRDSILRSMGDLILVSPSVQRKESAEHLQFVESNYNMQQIRRLNFLLFSLMWIDNHSSTCNTYDCSCKYLEVSWAELKDRIVDIGFLNEWWILAKNMENYDINY